VIVFITLLVLFALDPLFNGRTKESMAIARRKVQTVKANANASIVILVIW
jgi:hypothetical protein